MIVRIVATVVVLGIAVGSVAACGVKNDLEPPPGAIQQKHQNDPSRPPKPLGQ